MFTRIFKLVFYLQVIFHVRGWVGGWVCEGFSHLGGKAIAVLACVQNVNCQAQAASNKFRVCTERRSEGRVDSLAPLKHQQAVQSLSLVPGLRLSLQNQSYGPPT